MEHLLHGPGQHIERRYRQLAIVSQDVFIALAFQDRAAVSGKAAFVIINGKLLDAIDLDTGVGKQQQAGYPGMMKALEQIK